MNSIGARLLHSGLRRNPEIPSPHTFLDSGFCRSDNMKLNRS